jgi:pimeloyl-ACP methyl ester carboxylesterase
MTASPPVPRVAVDDGWRRTSGTDGTGIAWRCDAPADAASGTPVVLCNGIACATDYWTELAADLATARPVVQWDYRGHGRSDGPSQPDATTVDDIVGDLAAVLDAAGIDRAVFAGHSFGVQVVLEAARRLAPARVAAVVAIAGAAGAPLPRSATRARIGPLELLSRAHHRRPKGAGDAWRAWWRSPVPHVLALAVGGTSTAAPPSVLTSYYEHVSTRDLGMLLAMVRAMQGHDASDVVGGLHAPLLVLAGDADRLTPLPVMASLALAAPDGELAVCHGGTHTLPAERPDWVATQLRPLLERIDAREARPAAHGDASRATHGASGRHTS